MYNFDKDYADLISSDTSISEYFEEAITHKRTVPKNIANWICGDVLRYLKQNKKTIAEFPISPQDLSLLVYSIENKVLSNNAAKSIFSSLCRDSSLSIGSLIAAQSFAEGDDEETKKKIKNILFKHEEQIQQYKRGKTKILGFFVGKVMKETKGRINPEKVNKILKEILQEK